MKQTKIFYFDVDGTLLDNKSNSISENTIRSLKKLKELDYKVALCTGRTHADIKKTELEDLIEWDGYVLANGSEVLDKNKNIIFSTKIDPATIHRIQNHLGDKPIRVEGPDDFITKEAHQPIFDAFDHFGIDERYQIQTYDNQIVYNLLAYDTIDDEVLEEISSSVQIFKDQLGNYELIPIDSGKHVGIKKLNQLLDLEYHVVFGDGENDYTMLRDADFSVAMGNSVASLKEVADYTTTNVSDDGVYKALIKYQIFRKDF